MNVPLPDLGDDRSLLCPLCFEAVEEASVERREVQREEPVPTVSETPEISGAMTFEEVEVVALSPCGHATHRTGEDRPDMFLPWVYEDPGMSEEFEALQDRLSEVEERVPEFEISLSGQVGLFHATQERPRPWESAYLRFEFEEWTVPEISDLPYEENPVQIPKLYGFSPTEDWTSEPWSGLDRRTTVRTVYYVRYPDEVDL